MSLEKHPKSFRPTLEEKEDYVKMAQQGHSSVEIAKKFDRNPHTVRKWLKSFHEEGIKGLQSKKRKGRKPKKYKFIKEVLENTLEPRPIEIYGRKRQRKLYFRLSDLYKDLQSRGVKVSKTTLLKVLENEGWTDGSRPSYYQPNNYYIKQE